MATDTHRSTLHVMILLLAILIVALQGRSALASKGRSLVSAELEMRTEVGDKISRIFRPLTIEDIIKKRRRFSELRKRKQKHHGFLTRSSINKLRKPIPNPIDGGYYNQSFRSVQDAYALDDYDDFDYSADYSVGSEVRLKNVQNCSSATQGYYSILADESLGAVGRRIRVYLKHNESSIAKWPTFYNVGKLRSRGYPRCYNSKAMKGPCAHAFSNMDCVDYGVEQTNIFYPACCDAEGCFCECINFCLTESMLRISHDSEIPSIDYDACTKEVNSSEEGKRWKERECNKTMGKSMEFKDAENRCRKRKGDEEYCLEVGHCFKNICKYCYKWDCKSSLKKKKRELETRRKALKKDRRGEDSDENERGEEVQKGRRKRKKSKSKRRRRRKKIKRKRKPVNQQIKGKESKETKETKNGAPLRMRSALSKPRRTDKTKSYRAIQAPKEDDTPETNTEAAERRKRKRSSKSQSAIRLFAMVQNNHKPMKPREKQKMVQDILKSDPKIKFAFRVFEISSKA